MPFSPLSDATYTALGGQPAASAAAIRSSPSATNDASLSRQRRPWSLRISFSASLWELVITVMGEKKGAAPVGGAPGEGFRRCLGCLGRRGLASALGKSA